MQNAEKEAYMWGMLCHLAAFAAYLGIPFGHIIGPVMVWLIKRNDYPFVDECGREALNFNISMTIYGIVAGLLVVCTYRHTAAYSNAGSSSGAGSRGFCQGRQR